MKQARLFNLLLSDLISYFIKIGLQNTEDKIKINHTIANPTSAFFRAGPSLVPSPVTATTCLCSKTVLSIIPKMK